MHTGEVEGSWLVRVSVILTVSPLCVSLVSSVTWEQQQVKGTAYPQVVRTRILYSSRVRESNGAVGVGVCAIPIHIWGSN